MGVRLSGVRGGCKKECGLANVQVSALVENKSKKKEGTVWVNRNNKDDGREKGSREE